jgi:hypothetical protein
MITLIKNLISIRRYRVMVEGGGLVRFEDGAVKNLGFVTTRFVDSPNAKLAGVKAMDLVRRNSRWKGLPLVRELDPFETIS